MISRNAKKKSGHVFYVGETRVFSSPSRTRYITKTRRGSEEVINGTRHITTLFCSGDYVECIGKAEDGRLLCRRVGEPDGVLYGGIPPYVQDFFSREELTQVHNRYYVTPNCCDKAKYSCAVYVSVDIYSDEGSNSKPYWYVRTYSPAHRGVSQEVATHCPFCGSRLPKIVLSNRKDKVCVVTDGGDYCDTCNQRLRSCTCLPPEFKWKADAI